MSSGPASATKRLADIPFQKSLSGVLLVYDVCNLCTVAPMERVMPMLNSNAAGMVVAADGTDEAARRLERRAMRTRFMISLLTVRKNGTLNCRA